MTFDPHTAGEQPAAGPSALPELPGGTSKHKFVSFFLGEKRYAIPAHAVCEVVGYITPTRLPDAPSALLGIAPLRGDILAVVDAGASRTTIPASKQKAVVLRPSNGTIELPIAFNVDRLGELLQIGRDEIRSLTHEDPLASFKSSFEGKSVLLIEPSRIQSLLSSTEQ
jgi:purine-binding chemotaxis protein CheW